MCLYNSSYWKTNEKQTRTEGIPIVCKCFRSFMSILLSLSFAFQAETLDWRGSKERENCATGCHFIQQFCFLHVLHHIHTNDCVYVCFLSFLPPALRPGYDVRISTCDKIQRCKLFEEKGSSLISMYCV